MLQLTLFLSYNFEFKQELLKYGHFVKVLSPDFIKEDFKGSIELESELGVGTSFKVLLPVMHANVQIDKSNDITCIGKGKCVLVVDDEEGIRELLGDCISDYGITVLSAENGEVALKILEDSSGPIDLIISDIKMTHMDRITFL